MRAAWVINVRCWARTVGSGGAAMQSGPYDVVVDGLVHARLPQKATTEVEFAVGRHTQNQLLGGGGRAEATAVSRRCALLYGGAVSLGKYGWCLFLVGAMGRRR